MANQVGNTTLAYATLQLAISNGWKGDQLPNWAQSALRALPPNLYAPFAEAMLLSDAAANVPEGEIQELKRKERAPTTVGVTGEARATAPSTSALNGFEDLGESLELDSNVLFGVKLLLLSLAVSYVVK